MNESQKDFKRRKHISIDKTSSERGESNFKFSKSIYVWTTRTNMSPPVGEIAQAAVWLRV